MTRMCLARKQPSMAPRAVVVAGTHSGVGKTSMACGLMVALRQRGLTVQAFKVGPDFLDPMHHEAATGRSSINLDGWMLSKQQVLDTFHRHMVDADIAVVEGVMGLFDSRDGKSEDGSTAQIAKWLGVPVILVIDCWAMARSVAALVKGYTSFDQDLNLAGLFLNKVGGAAHGTWLREALEAAGQTAAVLGCIPKDDAVAVSERYLGLTMPHEQQQQQQQEEEDKVMPPYLANLGQLVAAHVDLERLLLLAAATTEVPAAAAVAAAAAAQVPAAAAAGVSAAALVSKDIGYPSGISNGSRTAASSNDSSSSSSIMEQSDQNGSITAVHKSPKCRCRIAVARDEAFCFYYHDNIALLRAYGADIVYFSPLEDTSLPETISGIYFGGGYPERYLQRLSNNINMLSQIRRFADLGGVIYAECGGLLYLSQGFWSDRGCEPSGSSGGCGSSGSGGSGISSSSSSSRELVPLVGVFPFTVQMGAMKMGYVEVQILGSNMLFPAGAVARGQVYHFSEIVECKETSAAAAGAAAAGSSLDLSADTPCNASTQIGISSTSSSGGSSSSSEIKLTYKTLQLTPGAQPVLEGYCCGNALASYVHLHWGGCPDFAAALVDKCSSNGVVDAAAAAAAAAIPGSKARHNVVGSDNLGVDTSTGTNTTSSSSSDTSIQAANSSSSSTNAKQQTANGSGSSDTCRQTPNSSSSSATCRQAPNSSGSNSVSTGGRPGCTSSPAGETISSSSSSSSSTKLTISSQSGASNAAVDTAAAAVHSQQQQCSFCSSSSSSTKPSGSCSSSSIVSLLPSGTEILYALGLSDQITAVSGFCDWPHEASLKPKAVLSLVDVNNMTSDEIEQQMQAFKAAGGSPFEIDVELLTQHKPGLVITQDACQTCDADQSLVCKALLQSGLDPSTTQLLVLHPKTLAEVLDSIITVGQAATAAAAAAGSSIASSSSSSASQRAHNLVESLQLRLARVAAAVAEVCPAAAAVAARCTVHAAAAAAAQIAATHTPATGRMPSSGSSTSGGSSSSSSNRSDQWQQHKDNQQHTSQQQQPQQHLHHQNHHVQKHINHLQKQQQQHQQGQTLRMASAEPWRLARPARVLSLEGLNPLVLGGQWLSDVKLAAGCVDASGQKPGDNPQRITWQQVLEYAPDVLLLCPCSRSAAAALPDVHAVTQLPGFSSLPAVQSGRVYVIDHGFYSRPGPRLIEGVELLARLVYGVDVRSDHHYQQHHQQQQQRGKMTTGCCESDGAPVLMMAYDDNSGHVTWGPCRV